MTIPIENLRNLGPKTGRLLRDVGIATIDDLRKIGPLEAYCRLKITASHQVSINALWAMQAGLLDMPWQHLPPEIKSELRLALERKLS